MENDNTKNSTLPLPFAYQEKRNRLYFKDYKLLETVQSNFSLYSYFDKFSNHGKLSLKCSYLRASSFYFTHMFIWTCLLYQFSPAVTSALANNCLTGTLRSEFIRDICTDISSHGIAYINKEERNKVSFAIVTKYPHLKDAIGSGLVCHNSE